MIAAIFACMSTVIICCRRLGRIRHSRTSTVSSMMLRPQLPDQAVQPARARRASGSSTAITTSAHQMALANRPIQFGEWKSVIVSSVYWSR